MRNSVCSNPITTGVYTDDPFTTDKTFARQCAEIADRQLATDGVVTILSKTLVERVEEFFREKNKKRVPIGNITRQKEMGYGLVVYSFTTKWSDGSLSVRNEFVWRSREDSKDGLCKLDLTQR